MNRREAQPRADGRIEDPSPNVLNSRIGRRLVLLFVGCALGPVLVLAIVSRQTVMSRLRADADRMLHAQTKNIGQALAERLLRLEHDLEALGMASGLGPDDSTGLPGRIAQRIVDEYESVTVVELLPDGSEHPQAELLGRATTPPALGPKEREHLAASRSLLRETAGGLELSLLLTTTDRLRIVRGRLADGALFGAFGVRPPRGVVHVLTRDGKSLFDSETHPTPDAIQRFTAANGPVEWTDSNGEEVIGRTFRLFLTGRHRIDWLIVHGRTKAELLAPVRGAESLLIGAAVLALLSALALSLSQIRRTLDPIRRLIGGTRAVQAGRLDVRLQLDRPDEFGDLGDSFDEMVSALKVAIDRREQTERELRNARDEAVRSARAQTSFVTNVSHEFRTPVSCILSSAEVLREFADGDPEATREFSGLIVDEARHLTRLVEDTLALSGGDTVASELPTEPVDPRVAIQEAVDARGEAERARIRIEGHGDVPTVAGEQRQLVRLLDRLIDNALKFSAEADPVVIRCFVRDPDTMAIEVSDTGEGIDRQDHRRIFDRFVQVGRDQRTDKATGTGIGLTLARRIAENHGGRILVESEPGVGSTFRIELPLVQAPEDARVPLPGTPD